MTRGAAVAAVVLALLVSGTMTWTFARAAPRQAYASTVCVAHDAPKASHRGSERVLAAAVRTLTPDERASLEDALTLSVTRWEARANPMLEDIEGLDPDRSLNEWLRQSPAPSRVARTATRRQICALDGLCVRATFDGTCPQGWSAPRDANEEARARFLAWPWGKAMRFRATTPLDAQRAAARLRESARTSKQIGLVLAADDADVAREPPYAHLRELWRRQATLAAIVEGTAREAPFEHDTDLTIADGRDIVVLPRLDGIDRESELVAAVLAAAPALFVVAR